MYEVINTIDGSTVKIHTRLLWQLKSMTDYGIRCCGFTPESVRAVKLELPPEVETYLRGPVPDYIPPHGA